MTPEYLKALADCKRHHEISKTYSGKLLRPHAPYIKEIVDRLGCKTALDYGCGKGLQYEWVNEGQTLEQYWGLAVTKYDPAYPPFAAEPTGKYDLVICTHVLGAIPKSDRGWVLDRIYGFADKAVFIAEKIGPIGKRSVSGSESLGAMQWIDEIAPHRTGVETHFSVRYKNEHGAFTGRFRL